MYAEDGILRLGGLEIKSTRIPAPWPGMKTLLLHPELSTGNVSFEEDHVSCEWEQKGERHIPIEEWSLHYARLTGREQEDVERELIVAPLQSD